MEKICIIGLDLAKRAIQVHAAGISGRVILRRQVSRDKHRPEQQTVDNMATVGVFDDRRQAT